MYRFVIIFLLGIAVNALGQGLKSGPMVGHVQLRDAAVWVQTKTNAKVKITYLEEGSDATISETSEIQTTEEGYHIASFSIGGLMPGKKYNYNVIVDGKIQTAKYEQSFKTQEHWAHRKDAPDFKFSAGSCMYVNDPGYDRPGKPYGSNYQIFNTIDSMRPEFMVWLGDNTYLREGDFESVAGIYNRYSHTRALPELQKMIARTPNYAIWDDHDYGVNDADRTYRLKNHTLSAFKSFWPNESYHTCGLEGVSHRFEYNDCDFFMLDDRWYKTASKEGTILGRNQIEWFKDALLGSDAKFKFVAFGGQVVSDYAGKENLANYAHERKEILDFIDKNKIKNVVFLTGDRHHSELTKYISPSGTVVYDITSSALTSGTSDHSSEPNTLRVQGSMIGVNNFAMIEVTGPPKERKAKVTFYDANGKPIFIYNL
jgi:alkaline phosphatase D